MSLTNLSSERFKLKWFDAASFELNRKEGSSSVKAYKALYCFFCGRIVEKSDLEQHHLSCGKNTILGRTIIQKKTFERNIETLDSNQNLPLANKHNNLPASSTSSMHFRSAEASEPLPANTVSFREAPEFIPVAPPSSIDTSELLTSDEVDIADTGHTTISAVPPETTQSTGMEHDSTTTTYDDIKKKFDDLKKTGFKHLTYDIMARAEAVDESLRQDLAGDIDIDGKFTTADNAQFKKKVQKEGVTYLVKGGINDALANLIMNLFTPDSAPKGKIAIRRTNQSSNESHPVSLIKFYREFINAGGIGNERGGRFALIKKFYHNCETPDEIKPLAQVTAMLFFLNEWDGNCQNFGEVDGKLVRIDNAATFGSGDTAISRQLLARILNLSSAPDLADIINENIKIQDEKQQAFVEQFITTLKNATSTFSNKTFCDYFFGSAFPPECRHQLPPIRAALEERLKYITDIVGDCNDTPAADGLQDIMFLIGEAERRGVTLKALKDMSKNLTASG